MFGVDMILGLPWLNWVDPRSDSEQGQNLGHL